MLCLTNTGFEQCYSLGSRKVCCMAVFILFYSVIFCFARFASLWQTSCLCNAFFVARSLLHAFVVSNLCFILFASPTLGLCSTFPFGSPQLYTLLFLNFFVLVSLLLLCVLCPTSSGSCSDFSPAPLEFARLIFCFVLFSFVAFVLYLVNLFGVFYFTLFTVVLFPRPL